MSDLSDRLFVLLIAATGLLVLFVGWEWALVEAVETQLAERIETGLYVALALVFLLILIGVWIEFRRVDRSR